MNEYTVYLMDVFDGLKEIRKAGTKVDCAITSPPYWGGVRNYGVDGQLGLEENPNDYIRKMVRVFRKTGRCLKFSGSLWLNMGDCYFHHLTGSGRDGRAVSGGTRALLELKAQGRKYRPDPGVSWLKPKQKVLMPHRIAIAMQDDGWLLRNDCVWFKPSYVPSSVKDRLTNSFEFLFHFVLRKRYYYNLDAIRIPHKFGPRSFNIRVRDAKHGILEEKYGKLYSATEEEKARYNLSGEKIFPEKLNPNSKYLETLNQRDDNSLRAGSYRNKMRALGLPEGNPLGKNPGDSMGPFRKYTLDESYKTTGMRNAPEPLEPHAFHDKGKNPSDFWRISPEPFREKHRATFPTALVRRPLLATCPKNGTVLDPFFGTGTTFLEAQNQEKNGIGIELHPKYIPLIRLRLNGDKFQQSLNPNKIKIIRKVGS